MDKGEIDAVSYGTAITLGRILKCQLILISWDNVAIRRGSQHCQVDTHIMVAG